MTAQSSNSFADTTAARVLALCLAGCFALILFFNYADDFGNLFNDAEETGLPTISAETAPAESANPKLAACLQQRIGDVDKMKDEGILSDSQYASFRARAEELCYQQNPA